MPLAALAVCADPTPARKPGPSSRARQGVKLRVSVTPAWPADQYGGDALIAACSEGHTHLVAPLLVRDAVAVVLLPVPPRAAASRRMLQQALSRRQGAPWARTSVQCCQPACSPPRLCCIWKVVFMRGRTRPKQLCLLLTHRRRLPDATPTLPTSGAAPQRKACLLADLRSPPQPRACLPASLQCPQAGRKLCPASVDRLHASLADSPAQRQRSLHAPMP